MTNVKVAVEKVCQDINISWSDPEINSALIDRYAVEIEPITCNRVNACIFDLQTTSFTLSKLEYGIKYTVSISACSCVECGPKQNIVFDSSHFLTEAGITSHLAYIIKYNIEIVRFFNFSIT